MDNVTDAQLGEMSTGDLVDLLVRLERQRRRVEAAQLRLLAAMQGQDDTKSG